MIDTILETIHVSPETIAMCRDFAERSVESSLDEYKRRKQFNRKKIEDDITTGKVVEFAISHALQAHGINCTLPDIAVYEAKQKSFDADLRFGPELQYRIHCKSQKQSQGKAYGISWVFQRYDKLVCKPSAEGLDLIAFSSIADTLDVVQLRHFVNAFDVKGLYNQLKLIHLKSKVAIYNDDLEALPALVTSAPWLTASF